MYIIHDEKRLCNKIIKYISQLNIEKSQVYNFFYLKLALKILKARI